MSREESSTVPRQIFLFNSLTKTVRQLQFSFIGLLFIFLRLSFTTPEEDLCWSTQKCFNWRYYRKTRRRDWYAAKTNWIGTQDVTFALTFQSEAPWCLLWGFQQSPANATHRENLKGSLHSWDGANVKTILRGLDDVNKQFSRVFAYRAKFASRSVLFIDFYYLSGWIYI